MINRMAPYLFLGCLILTLLALGCEEAPPPVVEAPVEEAPAKAKPGDMVLIPAGEFTMGTDENPAAGGLAYASPAHLVKMEKPYYIDVYEVTNGQWSKFLIETKFRPEGDWRRYYSIGKEDYPVANVTWDDAKAYCEHIDGRLPTEAEWERAARGPENSIFPWGDKYDPSKSNCNEMGYKDTVEVGRFEADKSGYGVYDTMGNLQEWTSEKLKPYRKSPVPRGDPTFRRGYISARGGSYAMKGSSMPLYTRAAYLPKSQYGIGFRCVKDSEEEIAASEDKPKSEN